MDEEVQELIAKWSDVLEHTEDDDWIAVNLIGEFIEDLRDLNG